MVFLNARCPQHWPCYVVPGVQPPAPPRLSQYFSPYLIPLPGFSGSHASACMKFTGRTEFCKLQNPALQRFCSLVLGQVPGICLFKKHRRNFCCRHPRTTPETLWPALVFSLGPLEGCMSLWLQIMDFISPFGWFTCVMSLVMPLLTQPDS